MNNFGNKIILLDLMFVIHQTNPEIKVKTALMLNTSSTTFKWHFKMVLQCN